MSSPRDPTTRLRQSLNPLSTLFPPGINNSPMSAVSMASPRVQQPMQSAGGNGIQPYNPREWASSSVQAMERPLPFSGTEAHGGISMLASPQNANQMLASAAATVPVPHLPPPPPLPAHPMPPPPYSPPRRGHQPRSASTSLEYGSVQIPPLPPLPPSRLSTLITHLPSPEPQHPRSFPPPPASSGLAGPSRDRLFGISLGRRKDREQLVSSPESMLPGQASRQIGSSSFQQPEPERVTPFSILSPQPIPPASRRAASTGALDTPNSARSRSAPQAMWESSMPVPPPPPRPPPTGTRSHSVQPMARSTVPIISPPTRRPPPSGVTSLGPVPPTPADWVDPGLQIARPAEHAQSSPRLAPPSQLVPSAPAIRARQPGLTIDVALAADPNQPIEPPLGSNSSPGVLNRTKAVRHDKTIIQRRTESRSQNDAAGSSDVVAEPRPIRNIIVPTTANGMAQKVALPKATPKSAGLSQLEPQPLTARLDLRESSQGPDSVRMKIRVAETPPFSPAASATFGHAGPSRSTPQKSLPTPPIIGRSDPNLRPDTTQPPVSAGLPLSKEAVIGQSADEFATGAIERFRAFAVMESTAATDAHRVRLFADFIVNESRLRRERYMTAIGAMGSEILDLTRDLFRPMAQSRRESGTFREEWAKESSEQNYPPEDYVEPTPRGDGSSSSAPASADFLRSPGQGPPPNWGNSNFMPSLSPILSQSVSDNYENGSSRGRAPSRWWEVDSQGDPSRTGFERTKRESKYMGVPKEQWLETERNPAFGSRSEQGPLSEYPPEKTGWHDQEEASQASHRLSYSSSGTHSSMKARQTLLDVSRLVTLPPPYPRHHPAVNNNHPELASIRTSVRALSKLDEIDRTKEEFAAATAKRRQDFSKAAADARQVMRANLQQEISSGNLSYADAGVIESDFEGRERDKKKELEKTEYEAFQNQVVLPLNGVLMERISRATELFDDLAQHLFGNGELGADMPQEEGDDRPELLEKLTLLKWIFEQRETLHRAIYDLLSDRNDRYCDVVLTPYRLSGNAEKLQSAKEFFAEDGARREHAFATEVLQRARDFRSVMEGAVASGVELQLSAFWDIAPPLCRLLEKIPQDLEDFGIMIPPAEFEENPAYHEHPLQYLYSLLLHAEKSSYQFIEAHTNQLCLLHEVKEAVVNAKARAVATQTAEADGTASSSSSADRERRAQQLREVESRRLTEDLKEKVRMVREQWNSALGEAMVGVKERTGEWLLSTGGWDETLEDGGVGVA